MWDEEERFAVVYCHEDESHSLVPESNIIFAGDQVKEKELVRFNYPGFSTLFTGTVKKTGTDFQELKAILIDLHTKEKPPREPSFHDDKPRRAAINHKVIATRSQGKQTLNAKSKGAKGKASSSQTVNSKRARTSSVAQGPIKKPKLPEPASMSAAKLPPLAKLLQSVTSSDSSSSSETENSPNTKNASNEGAGLSPKPNNVTDVSDSESNSDDIELDEKQIALLQKLAKREKFKDLRELAELASQKAGPSSRLNLVSSKSQDNGKPVHNLKSLTDDTDMMDLCMEVGMDDTENVSQGGSVLTSTSKQDMETNVDGKQKSNSNKRNVNIESRNQEVHNENQEKGKKDQTMKTPKKKVDADEKTENEKREPKKKVCDNGEKSKKKKELKPKKNTGDNVMNDPKDKNAVSNAENEDDGGDKIELSNEKDGEQSSSSSSDSESDSSPKVRRIYKKKGKKEIKDVKEYTFHGNFYRYNGSEAQTKVEKLSPALNLYVSSKGMRNLRRRWTTATAVARCLTRELFSDDALLVCSASGKTILNRRSGQYERRPALAEEGLSAVLDFTNNRCDKKSWPRQTEAALKRAINNMLYEERGCKVIA